MIVQLHVIGPKLQDDCTISAEVKEFLASVASLKRTNVQSEVSPLNHI